MADYELIEDHGTWVRVVAGASAPIDACKRCWGVGRIGPLAELEDNGEINAHCTACGCCVWVGDISDMTGGKDGKLLSSAPPLYSVGEDGKRKGKRATRRSSKRKK